MSYFARLRVRDSRRRPAPARYVLEALEGRTMLSGTASSVAASHERITSETVLQSSLTTAVTGARVTFNATVADARNDAPIASGTVNFTIESPQKIVLGNVNVNKQGAASIATKDLTKIGQYQIKAQYTPSNPKISASAGAPVTVKVIPIPLNVPTVTTLASAASTAEVGQYVPLVATVADAGTGTQVDAGRVEPIKGTVEFFTDSPTPIILGDVPLSGTDKASLPTNLLKNAGPYQIEAEFLPSNFFFTGSVSAPTTVTISPATHNSPTVTTLEAPTTTFETGESIPLNVTVQNADSGLANGVVQIVSVSRHPVVLATIDVSTIGRQISIVTDKLQKVGQYRIEAEFSPTGNRFAGSISAPVTVTVTPADGGLLRTDAHGPSRSSQRAVERHGHGPQCREPAPDELHRHDRLLQSHRFLDDFPRICVRQPRHHAAAASIDRTGDICDPVVHLHSGRPRHAHVRRRSLIR